MSRLLGIDHGLKRIGLAMSDASGLVARELLVIHRTTNVEDFARINRVAAEQRAEGIVVGIPLNDSISPSVYSQADTVRHWVERFGATTTLPITLWDEQYSSADAREIAIRQRRKPRDPIDDLAARVMLQSYLDAIRDGFVQPPTTQE